MKKILTMSVREMYAVLLITFMLLFSLIYTSMALFQKSVEKVGVASIVASEIEYVLTSTESGFTIDGNKGTIAVEAGETKIFNVTITNNTSINTRYKMYYKFANDVTILDVNVGISSISESPISDLINVGESKTVKIIINNNSTQKATIEIGAQGGYAANELVVLGTGRNEMGTIEETVQVAFVMDQAMPDEERTLYETKIQEFSTLAQNKNVNITTSTNNTTITSVITAANGSVALYDANETTTIYYYGVIGNKILYATNKTNHIYVYDVLTETRTQLVLQYGGYDLNAGGGNINFKNDTVNNILYIHCYSSVLSPTGIPTIVSYYFIYKYDDYGNLTKDTESMDLANQYNALSFSECSGSDNGPFLYDPNPEIIVSNGFGGYFTTDDLNIIKRGDRYNSYGQNIIFKINDKYGIVNYWQNGYNSNAAEMFMAYFTPPHTDETLDFSSGNISTDDLIGSKYYIILKRDNVNSWNYYNFTLGDTFTVDNLQDYQKYVIAGENSKEIIQTRLNGASNIEYYDYDYSNNFANLDTIFNSILGGV